MTSSFFCKADEAHGSLLKEILKYFCEFFGHKVNPQKTNIFFSKGVEEHTIITLSNLLGFQKVQDLGIILEFPSFIRETRIVLCILW